MMNLSPSNPSTASSLLQRARSDDSQAWNRIVLLYEPLVYRWSRKAGLQQNDADDIVQEVFGAVAKRLPEFRQDGASESFRRWLWGIARHKIVDHIRQMSKLPDAEGGSFAQQRLQQIPDKPFDEPEADGEFSPLTSLLYQALDMMKPDFEPNTWQAFWRSTISGQRAADIGEELGMTKKAVRQAKYRVLRRLRTEMNELL